MVFMKPFWEYFCFDTVGDLGDHMTDETIKKLKLWKLESYSYKYNVLQPISHF